MSIQLSLDEMLDILNWHNHPDYFTLKRQVEAVGLAVACAIDEDVPELTLCGEATFDGGAMGGTMAPFEPTAPGPVPDFLLFFDVEVEQWKDLCDDLF